MFASLGGHLDMVKILLDSGADIHAKSTLGFTAIDIAKDENYKEIERVLREWSAK
jgi:ankyrin repeat protein